MRYGTPRQCEVLHILVREPFDSKQGVKPDDAKRADVTNVLKLNQILDVPTGLYVYQQMHSNFWRVDDARLAKFSLTSNDSCGNTYKEARTFVIASKPPIVRSHLDKKTYRPGDAVIIRASASSTTRTVSARMYGVAPVALRWDTKSLTNSGRFTLPKDISPGRYTITVTAEDMAHNIGSQEVTLEILP